MPPTDQYEIEMQLATEINNHTLRFRLLPRLWDELSLEHSLTWYRVKFDSNSVDDVPDDLIGVYSFVIEPGVANHKLSYLVYIGMTKNQNFRARYRQYLRHRDSPDTGWIHVKHMLRAWSDHLMFYYAPLDDPEVVEETEEMLLEKLLPPIPRAFPASVSSAISLSRVFGGG